MESHDEPLSDTCWVLRVALGRILFRIAECLDDPGSVYGRIMPPLPEERYKRRSTGHDFFYGEIGCFCWDFGRCSLLPLYEFNAIQVHEAAVSLSVMIHTLRVWYQEYKVHFDCIIMTLTHLNIVMIWRKLEESRICFRTSKTNITQTGAHLI